MKPQSQGHTSHHQMHISQLHHVPRSAHNVELRTYPIQLNQIPTATTTNIAVHYSPNHQSWVMHQPSIGVHNAAVQYQTPAHISSTPAEEISLSHNITPTQIHESIHAHNATLATDSIVLQEAPHEVPQGLPEIDQDLVDALNAINPSFIATDPMVKDNPISCASADFLESTGYNTFEVVGRNCRFLQGPLTDGDAIRTISKALQDGHGSTTVLMNYKKDGTPYWNYLRIQPMVDSDGRLSKYGAIQVDVTKKPSKDSEPVKTSTKLKDGVKLPPQLASMSYGHEDGTDSKCETPTNQNSIRVDFYNLEYVVKVFNPQGPVDKFVSTVKSLSQLGSKDLESANREPTQRKILHGISGTARPGHVTAIMGPSGSGKTTLLSVLGSRINSGTLSGQVLFNGRRKTKQMKRYIGFVMQDDILFGDLTVRETLTITALLRLPNTMTREQKLERVEEVINTLGISKCADSLIGSAAMRGVSGGERKRVNVGNELITDPSVLMLDEPTSGLDSSTAFLLLVTLKRLATQGKTIVLSIHQPSSQMFAMLDQLILLADGHVTFQGKASQSLPYFANIGYECPAGFNMADYVMSLLADEDLYADIPSSKKKLIEEYDANVKSSIAKDIEANMQAETVATKSFGLASFSSTKSPSTHRPDDELVKDEGVKESAEPKWPTSFLDQFLVLCSRSFKLKRGQTVKSLLFWQYLCMSLIAGAIWFDVGTNEKKIRDRVGVTFFMVIYWSFQPLFSALTTFPSEKHILLKERASGAYRLSAYYLAKCTAEIPFELFWPSFSLLIVYWMTGLNPNAGQFFLYWTCLLINVLTAQSLGLAVSAGVDDFMKAVVIAATIMLGYMLISGYYANIDLMPAGIRDLRYITFLLYGFSSLLKTDFGDNINFECANDPDYQSTYPSCPGQYVDNQEILDEYHVDMEVGEYIGIMIGHMIFMRIVAYVVLKINSRT